jgi:putative cardiolipin synthase
VLPDTGSTHLGQAVAPRVAAKPNTTGAYLLPRGTDAFVARLALALAAERSLDLQYYIWQSDLTGKVLTTAVLRAADRGVRVRILLDDVGTAADDTVLLMLDAHHGIEVRLFNPITWRSTRALGFLADFSRTNRRMHNKSFTADNQMTIIGGRNIGDEYFEARPDVDFGDLDVVAIGPVVAAVSRAFDLYWNSEIAVPIGALTSRQAVAKEMKEARSALETFVQTPRAESYAQALEASRLAAEIRDGTLSFSWGSARLVYDDPTKALTDPADRSTHLDPQLRSEVDTVRSELLLVSPYFVPGKKGVEELRRVHARGVRVRIVTNSLASTDVLAVHSGYARYREALLEAGIELYEIRPTATRDERRRLGLERDGGTAHGMGGSGRAALHAKTLVFDRRAFFVGSMNLDARSAYLNTEIGLVIDNPALTAELLSSIDAALPEATYRVTLRRGSGSNAPASLEWAGLEDGREVRYTEEPLASGWQHFRVWLYSLLPIEQLL